MQGQPNPITGSTVRLAAAHLAHDEIRRASLTYAGSLPHADAAHHRRDAAETQRRQMGTPDLFAGTDAAAVLPEPGD